MQYQAKLPKHNSNVSQSSPLKEFATLLAGIGAVLLVLYWLSGLLVDYTVDHISDETAGELYQSLSQANPSLATSPSESLQEVNALLQKLVRQQGINYPISVSVVDTQELNALAFPTGHIVVYQGLLDKLESQNGLAFVLGHEVAHFKNRDHLRMMGRGLLLLAVSAIIGIGDSDVIQHFSVVSDFSSAQFSQQREQMADASALLMLNEVYGHVGGATEFFDLVMAGEQTNSTTVSHYFASHPQIQQRIDALNTLSKTQGFSSDMPATLQH
jgi:beta-barrel assembly-enhancing protease